MNSYPYSNYNISKISILFIPLFIFIINVSTFAFNFYLYVFVSSFIFLFFFSKNNIKAWYWLSFFLILYSFPHFTTYFFEGSNEIIVHEELNYIMNNQIYNLEAIRLTLSFILSLYLGHNLFNVIKRKSFYVKTKTYFDNKIRISSIKKIFLFSLLFLFFVYSISSIDFDNHRNKYSLSGFNILFAFCYMLQFFIIFFFIFVKEKKTWLILLFVIMYSIIMGSLGVRQILAWLYFSLLIAYFLKSYIYERRINYYKIIIYSLLVLIFFGLVLAYRNDKTFNLDIFSRTYEMMNYALLSETSFVFYNMMSSIQISSTKDLFFMGSFKDIFFYMIPRPIFPNKYEYISLYQFIKANSLSPFGASFYLAELKLSLRYDYLIYIFGMVVGYLSEAFLSYMIKQKKLILLVLYVLFLTMIIIFPIRGTIAGGIKIFISYMLPFYFLIKYRYLIMR